MKYYIVDDDIAVVRSLESIIADRNIGTVIGSNTNTEEAIEEIVSKHPDIVIVDFLMKEMDGVTLIERVKETVPDMYFIMLSKVSDKSMIQSAYTAGVEFFINKPINVTEIETVTHNVAERINLKRTFNSILGELGVNPYTAPAEQQPQTKPKTTEKKKSGIEIIISALGMMGEKGTKDIMALFEYMEENECNYSKEVLEAVAISQNDTAKNVEQRVRRAIKKGMRNAAAMRLDDPESDVSVIYSGYVFNHIALKMEMNNIEGTSPTGGRVNIAKFMDGLILYKNYIS